METNFNEIKQEILRRAKEASACKSEYGRAYAAENLSELSQVIKDNFDWVCAYGVLTVDLIEKYKEDFATNGIYVNQNAESGYLLCSNAMVKAYGNATVGACDSTTVEASGNAYCTSPYTIDCNLFDQAIYRVRDTNTVYYADSDIKFVKQ